MFEDLIKTQYPVGKFEEPLVPEDITYDDANVIRYAAGYVCRKVMKKIEKSSSANKQNLMKCLAGLLEEDGESSASASTHWIDAIDRGGLWHVKEGTYMLFSAMEEEIRCHFHASKVQEMTEGCKGAITHSVLANDDVLFHWCLLSYETDDEDATELLHMLVDLWITIQGFSFASSWLELYKREKKKGIQRSKPLRKDILKQN